MAPPSSEKAPAKKRGTRIALPMKLIEDDKKRYVSFSKRKKGLFAKSAALSSLFSGAVHIAAVIFSPQGKLFSYGHPSPDAVFHRYLALDGGGGDNSFEGHYGNYNINWWENVDVDQLSYEELLMFKSSMEEVRIRVSNKINDLTVTAEINKFENYTIGNGYKDEGFGTEDDYQEYVGLMEILQGSL